MSRAGADSRRNENDSELEARAREIYHEILRRTPEHDFDPTIDRVRRVVDILGSPQLAFRSIHLTGTNGKTSTARMIDALLRELGLRVGRFTSPHLSSVRERIAIDGEPISADAWVRTWDDISAHIAIVDGELTIKDVTKPVTFEVEFGGFGSDPYGNYKAGLTAKATIDRTDFGLTYNAALETGGVLIGEKVTITLDLQAAHQA